MGRKYKHLYKKICSFENIWLAARKARRGKRSKFSTAKFEFELENNLIELQASLKHESYHFGPYRYFNITEPKNREIAAAPYSDRVVHHALCNVIEPILDRAMIYDSYACRTGKGSHAAIDRAQFFLKRYRYSLKFDIKKYFFTIDHDLLLQDLGAKLTDPKVIRMIISILSTHHCKSEYYFLYPGDTLFDTVRPRGLPIGNLTSQLFANYFLTSLDRFIKEKLKMRAYLRYMDDGIIFLDDKRILSAVKDHIYKYCLKRRLSLNERKTHITPTNDGIKFLGFHLYPSYRRIPRENLKRFKQRLRQRCRLYENGDIPWENLLCSLNAWLGYADKDRHAVIINQILSAIKFARPGYPGKFYFHFLGK